MHLDERYIFKYFGNISDFIQTEAFRDDTVWSFRDDTIFIILGCVPIILYNVIIAQYCIVININVKQDNNSRYITMKFIL